MKKIAFLTVFLLIGISLFLWLGIYNIAANEKHWAVTNSLIEILRERSIETRAEEIVLPENITTLKITPKVAANYDEMCSICHLAPSKEVTELHIGLYPQPPVFYKAEEDHNQHDIKDMFWVIKNGIKLTGMPAWGTSHTDKEIWALVVFINQLNTMSADDYQKLTSIDAVK